MDKDLLHKTFVSLREIKQELYAKSFRVNDLRENYLPTLKTYVVNLKRDAKDLSRDLQQLEVVVNSDLKLYITETAPKSPFLCVCVCVCVCKKKVFSGMVLMPAQELSDVLRILA